MVISSSNRSPSPMSTRPNPNPNPNPNSRTHQEKEGVVPARKSFNGYPFGKPSIVSQPRNLVSHTPANSPAEYARSSISKDYEQKENERDPNSKPIVRNRSPSVLKGGKSFMAPTISAASKINPSPRKKVLGERNEEIRTSASLSGGKFHFFSTSSLEFSDESEAKEAAEQAPPSSTVMDFDKVGYEIPTLECEKDVADTSRKLESEPDMVVLSPDGPSNAAKSSEPLPRSEKPIASNVNSVIKIASYSSPSVIAPLDADPSLPPYDPKNNYLSPRPQFLHYRPNPRIDSYINQGIRLDDEFASESLSETTDITAETQSEYSQKEEEDSSSTSSSAVISSVEELRPCSESNPLETQQLEETVAAKIKPRRRFFTAWKAVAFLFVFLLGVMSYSVTYSPSLEHVVYRDEVISKIYNSPRVVADLAKANLDGLFQNAKLWSAHSVGHLSQKVFSFGEVHQFSPLPFSNLTMWQEDEYGDYVDEEFELDPYFDRIEGSSEALVDQSDESFTEMQSSYAEPEESEVVTEEETGKVEEPIESEVVTEEETGEVEEETEKVEEQTGLLPLTNHHHSKDRTYEVNEIEGSSTHIIEQAAVVVDQNESQESFHTPEENESKIDESEIQEADHSQEEIELETDVAAKGELSMYSSQTPEVHPQILTTSEPLAEDEELKSELVSVIPDAATTGMSQHLEASEMMSLAPTVTAVSLVLVSLLAATALMYKKKGSSEVSAPPLTNQLAAAKEKYLFHESPQASWSGPVEVDMNSESCPSEMSSFQKTTSYNSKRGGSSKLKAGQTDEAQSSLERRTRRSHKRESLASSSEYTMGSSYGSFTTYSIRPSKHGDDEVVTPVRRSSRIRNHVTSP